MHEGEGLGEQEGAVGPGVAGVGVGEELADVAEGGGAQEGVGEGVEDDVGVGVADEALLEGDVDAAEDQAAALRETVGVVSEADPHAIPPPLRHALKAAAIARSFGS
jgi:hypothetical protein